MKWVFCKTSIFQEINHCFKKSIIVQKLGKLHHGYIWSDAVMIFARGFPPKERKETSNIRCANKSQIFPRRMETPAPSAPSTKRLQTANGKTVSWWISWDLIRQVSPRKASQEVLYYGGVYNGAICCCYPAANVKKPNIRVALHYLILSFYKQIWILTTTEIFLMNRRIRFSKHRPEPNHVPPPGSTIIFQTFVSVVFSSP